VFFYALLITGSTLAAVILYRERPVQQTRTIAFMTLAFAQLFHLGNARSDRALTGREALSNPYALAAIMLSIVLQLIAAYVTPLSRILGVVPLESRDWIVVVGLAAVPAIIGQAIRLRRPASYT
jgi:Ca2+-transporting ATPase